MSKTVQSKLGDFNIAKVDVANSVVHLWSSSHLNHKGERWLNEVADGTRGVISAVYYSTSSKIVLEIEPAAVMHPYDRLKRIARSFLQAVAYAAQQLDGELAAHYTTVHEIDLRAVSAEHSEAPMYELAADNAVDIEV